MKSLLLAALFTPSLAWGDLSFVQITQGQTSRGGDGIFGKTWVEVKDHKMRLVSGYARRLPEDRDENALAPRRIVQVLDIPSNQRIVMHPERKAYSRRKLGEIDYGNEMGAELRQGEATWRIIDTEVVLEKRLATRKMLGVKTRHHRIRAKMVLESPSGERAIARMEQNMWVAPIGGKLFKPLLDLMTFENEYRQASGGWLSPLDHERYQIKEVAGYLQVPDGELRRLVWQVRDRFRDFAGYPVASAVAWWREDVKTNEPGVALGDIKPTVPKSGPRNPPPNHRYSNTGARYSRYRPKKKRTQKKSTRKKKLSRFKVINWRRSEQRINSLYKTTMGQFPFGPLLSGGRRESSMVRRQRRKEGVPKKQVDIYPAFEKELRKVLKLLVDVQDQERKAGDPEPIRRGLPFYEVYSELHGLDSEMTVPASVFTTPSNWKQVRR
jgi:hypothetical protein